jgi:predicted enzyme involved in methoxymalonyl-ACP biosynthesis
MLGVVAAESVRLGAGRLIGEYVPSGRNAMVKDHYANLGFTVIATDETGASRAVLALADHVPASTFIAVKAG